MRKNFLFIVAVAALLAGCSNSDILDEKEQAVNPPVVNQDGEVEIAMQASTNNIVQSRAVVDAWNNTPVTIWGLNKAVGADWTNVKSQAFTGGFATGKVVDAAGAVAYDNSNRYFYPLDNSINFSFYACSPTPVSKQTFASSVTANFLIDGKTDVLWGPAVAADHVNDGITYQGFNARYLRKGGTAPILAFEHRLTQLKFKAILGAENGGTSLAVKVKKVTIKQLASNATLTVAGANAGVCQAQGTTPTNLSLYFGDVKLEDGNPVSPVNDVKGADLGSVMLLPAASYEVSITLVATDGGKDYEQTSTLTVKNTNDDPFDIGTAYTINLTIYGLRDISMTASLSAWKDGATIDQEVN